MGLMPSSPRLRHVLMQAVLCAVLGVTLLLAMAVIRRHRDGSAVALDVPHHVGTISVRGPAGWEARQGADGIRFDEPAARSGGGRRLEVWQAACTTFISPLEYLVRAGDLRLRDVATLLADASRGRAGLKPASIGGWPGILISHTRLLPAENGVMAPRGQTLACAVMPDGQAVLVRLETDGIASEESERLVRRVAAGIAPDDAPALAGDVSLEDDLSIRLPAMMIASSGEDKFRVARRFHARDPQRWVAVELVPCIVGDGEGQVLPAMLRLRDPAFRPGPVRQLDEQTWVCERAERSVGPAIAYLLAGQDGRALLADFRWIDSGRGEAQLAEALWDRLRGNVIFDDSPVMAQREQTAAEALAALPEDAAELFRDVPAEQEWKWYHESWPRTGPMTSTHALGETAIIGEDRTDGWPPPAGEGLELRQWHLSRTWNQYRTSIRRGGVAPVLSQSTVINDRQLRTLLLERGKPAGLAVGTTPPLFIPGAALPHVLGRLPFEPMVLRTESILWPTASASPVPLTLVLEPSFDVPRRPDTDAGDAMRCWRIRVSGLSDSSRWYLDSSGRLHSVSYAHEIRLMRVEAPADPPAPTRPAE